MWNFISGYIAGFATSKYFETKEGKVVKDYLKGKITEYYNVVANLVTKKAK